MPSVNRVRAFDKRTGKIEVETIAPDIPQEQIEEAVGDYLDKKGVYLKMDTDGIVNLGG